MSAVVPLIRWFQPISKHYQEADVGLDDLLGVFGRGERLGWSDLKEMYRIVVLADAGAGKTYELKAEATRMAATGLAAFFIRIEDIDTSFAEAFEVGSQDTFSQWLSGGDEEAWFFLDSVDEVRLGTPRAFETALRAFAAQIHDARHRAHVVVSSRPYAWRTKLDRELVNEILPYAPPRAEVLDSPVQSNSEESEEDDEFVSATVKESAAEEDLRLFQLAPLDDDDIRIFAGHRGVGDANAFLQAVSRAGLFDRARRPFDLESLLATWKESGTLIGRLAVVEQDLVRRLSPPRTRGALTLERALEGAQRLALAATLTSESNIAMPDGETGGLDAAALLADWTKDEVRQLLGRGVFSDPLYSMVRFRHRETRELLSAQRLAEALRSGQGRAEVEGLIFKDVYGEPVVVPRMRPLLPWLILFDEPVRVRALALDAKIGVEGGDPAQLPLDVRTSLLRNVVRQIAKGEVSGADNTEIARIAQPNLADETLRLLDTYGSQNEVMFFLGRLIWQGEMTGPAGRMVPVALDPTRDIYSRIVAIRAVMTILAPAAGRSLWTELFASKAPLPRRLLAELIEGAVPDEGSVALLLASLEQAKPHKRFDSTGLSAELHRFVDRLPLTHDRAPNQPLVRLMEGLALLLAREPYIERRECKVSEAFAWLMPVALHVVERLVKGRSAACFDRSALEVLNNTPALRHWGGKDFKEHKTVLGELIPRWIELNDALFWYAIITARAALESKAEALDDDWAVSWMSPFWRFDAASFDRTLAWIPPRNLQDDRLVALRRTFRTYAGNGRQRKQYRRLWRAVTGDPVLETALRQLMRPAPSPSVTRWRSHNRNWARQSRVRKENEARWRAAWVDRLKADSDRVRHPPGLQPGQISRDQLHLMHSVEKGERRLTRSAGARWRDLIPEFGAPVAEAFRDAALAQWRAYRPPLASEGHTGNGIPYALIFAMAGLELEAGPDGRGLNGLSKDDVHKAMRYAVWELNGFPAWFEPLYRAHPDLGFEVIWGETRWDLANAKPDQPMHYLLHDLVYHAPWLHSAFAVHLRDWLTAHGAVNGDVLRYSRTIMVGGGISAADLAALAERRSADLATPGNQSGSWFALWVDADADRAIPALTSRLARLERLEATSFAETFIVNLVGGRRTSFEKLGTWRTPEHLKTLYLLMHQHIRVEDDITHPSGEAFSPGPRDDAQEARSHLFTLLAELPGQASYQAIMSLAVEHPEADYRGFMRRRAHERAVADSDQAWTFDEARSLDGRLRSGQADAEGDRLG